MSLSVQEETTRKSWALDTVHSSVEFAVKHMMVATVRGRFANFDVKVDFDPEKPADSSVEARIEAASVETNAGDRDGHLRSADFFDAEKYPFITFKSRRVERQGNGNYAIVGDLTIKGVTREVVLDTEFAGTGKSPWGATVAAFSAETKIDRKDFGLTWNAALETGGMLVGDQVKIHIELELVAQ
ncbi:MAG TPA: YceI family protein [Chloroflexota bacterium]